MSKPPQRLRSLRAVLILVSSGLLSTGAAVLTYVDTAHVARAIFVGAGAAGGALVLLDKLISGSASDDK